MASEYLVKTVNGYEDYIKNHEIDGQVLNAYVMATQTAICTEHDINDNVGGMEYSIRISYRKSSDSKNRHYYVRCLDATILLHNPKRNL